MPAPPGSNSTAKTRSFGQVLRETGTFGTDEYTYDKAGRLTLTKETPTGEGCTTRAYAFDEDSNRTSKITREPKEGGACDTTSEGTEISYAYDSGDRLIGEGTEYDNFGRITATGDPAFVVISAIIVVLAASGLVLLRLRPNGW